jgi:hypothetical protein
MADRGTVILSFQDDLGFCVLHTSHLSTYVSRSFEASEHINHECHDMIQKEEQQP